MRDSRWRASHRAQRPLPVSGKPHCIDILEAPNRFPNDMINVDLDV
jgi:hypothetical protein